jgi:hypothetical protein
VCVWYWCLLRWKILVDDGFLVAFVENEHGKVFDSDKVYLLHPCMYRQ